MPDKGIKSDSQHLICSKLTNGSGVSGEGLVLCGTRRANDIDVPWSARKRLKKLNMTDMQQLLVGMHELNERVQIAEARATR